MLLPDLALTPASTPFFHNAGRTNAVHFDMTPEAVGSIAKCESPTFAEVCPSETPLARTYRHPDLNERRTCCARRAS
jgi:hypothetical protein